MLAGFGCGLAVGGFLEWYFNRGPAAGSQDAGMAHGLWLMALGFPVSFLPIAGIGVLSAAMVHALAVLSVGVSWGLLWGAVSLLWRWTPPEPGREPDSVDSV